VTLDPASAVLGLALGGDHDVDLELARALLTGRAHAPFAIGEREEEIFAVPVDPRPRGLGRGKLGGGGRWGGFVSVGSRWRRGRSRGGSG